MLTKERMIRILDQLEEKQFVSVKELQEAFGVSRSSVMRDLIELENQGLIQRERGGASLKSVGTLSSLNEVPVASKENVNSDAKEMICAQAAKHIQEGQCIYIDSGTTPVYLLNHLGNKKIKLVTPSIYLIRKLPHSFQGDIFLLGGEYSRNYGTSAGSLTNEMIQQFHFDHAFLSANGLDVSSGEVYVFDFSVGAMKKEILKRSKVSDLLIDQSKFSTKAICHWANIEDFDSVYVDGYNESEEIPDNFITCGGTNNVNK